MELVLNISCAYQLISASLSYWSEFNVEFKELACHRAKGGALCCSVGLAMPSAAPLVPIVGCQSLRWARRWSCRLTSSQLTPEQAANASS